MEWWIILLLVLGGVFTGFINTLAGSGSLISLPLLIFLGLPANVANGTNRINILLQSLVGFRGFTKHKKLDIKQEFRFVIPTVIGSLIGAQIAVDLNKEALEKVIGAIMIFMIPVILLDEKKWLREHSQLANTNKYIQFLVFFLVGIYGGFIQAGIGIFILVTLVINAGYDLISANAIKLLIVFVYTPFALAVFIFNNQVDWLYGIILAAGSMLGALIATKLAVKRGVVFVRFILILIVIASAIKLLFF